MSSPLEPRAWRGDGVEIDLKTGKPKVKAMTSPLNREKLIIELTKINPNENREDVENELMPLIDQYAQLVAREELINALTAGEEYMRHRIKTLEKERKHND